MTSRPSIVALSAMALIVLAGSSACAEHRPLAGADPFARHRRCDHRSLGHRDRHARADRGVPFLALRHPRFPSGALGRGCNRGHRRSTHHRRRHLDHLSSIHG